MGLLFILIVLILLLSLPCIVLYFLYKWLSGKGYGKAALIGICLIVISSVYSIYTAVYPNDSFFKDEYANGLKLPFPSSGKIETKDAGYPDFHGHYCSCSIIKMSNADYNSLKQHFIKDPTFISSTNYKFSSEEFQNVINNSHDISINNILWFNPGLENIRNEISLGFLNDKNSIILQRCQF